MKEISFFKFVLIGIIAAICYFETFYDNGSELTIKIDQANNELNQKKQKLQEDQILIDDKTKFEQERNLTEEQLKIALHYLPSDLNVMDLIKQITNEVKTSSNRLINIQPNYFKNKFDFYEEIQTDLELDGSFVALSNFLVKMSKISKIIKFKKLIFTPNGLNKEGKIQLNLKASLAGYSYINNSNENVKYKNKKKLLKNWLATTYDFNPSIKKDPFQPIAFNINKSAKTIEYSNNIAIKEEQDRESTVIESQTILKPLMVKFFPIVYSSVEDIAKNCQQFLSSRGKVISDHRNQAVIATDISENLEHIEKLIQSLDMPPQQVLIEGKIVEALETFSNSIDITWTLADNTSIQTSDGLTIRPRIASQSTSNFVKANGLRLGFDIGILEPVGNLNAILALAENESKLKILASPRIVVTNNESEEIIYNTEVSKKASLNAPTLKMTIKPKITNDGGIVLDIDVKKEFYKRFNKQVSKTKILLKNDQIAVLGGIYKDDITIDHSLKNELLIFLTPRVLKFDMTSRERRLSMKKNELNSSSITDH